MHLLPATSTVAEAELATDLSLALPDHDIVLFPLLLAPRSRGAEQRLQLREVRRDIAKAYTVLKEHQMGIRTLAGGA